MNVDHEQLLQDLVCGDRSESEADVQAILRATPALQRRLAALRAAQGRLAALATVDDDDAEIGSLVAGGDRAALDAALRPVRREQPRRAMLALAATALVAIGAAFALLQPSPAAGDGRLGGGGATRVVAAAGGWTLQIDEPLPPGASYHLRLELADGQLLTADAATTQWTFPEAWNQAAARANGATLVVAWDDGTGLVVRRSLPLR